MGFPGGKEPACQCRRLRDAGSTPESGRSPGGGHGYPLQYSCLENPMDRGAWQATVHGVAQSQRQLKWLSSLARSRKKTAKSTFSLYQLVTSSKPARLPSQSKLHSFLRLSVRLGHHLSHFLLQILFLWKSKSHT